MALVDLDLCEILEEISTDDLIFELSNRGVDDIQTYCEENGKPMNTSWLSIDSQIILEDIDTDILIDFLNKKGYILCDKHLENDKDMYAVVIEKYATQYDIKRALCDLVGSSYAITNDDLLNKIKEVI